MDRHWRIAWRDESGLARDKVAADVLPMREFRRSNVELQLQQLKELDAARRQAEPAAEAGTTEPAD